MVQQKEYKPKRCANVECKPEIDFLHRRNSYCSYSCSAHVSNKNRAKYRQCAGCNTQILNSRNSKYCNLACHAAHRLRIFEQKFESGALTDFDRKRIRKVLINRYGYQCSICNGTEWLGKPIPVVLDHIDGDCNNNSPDNIRLVCGNCNMQLPTFAGRNRGKSGRVGRKEKRQ